MIIVYLHLLLIIKITRKKNEMLTIKGALKNCLKVVEWSKYLHYCKVNKSPDRSI